MTNVNYTSFTGPVNSSPGDIILEMSNTRLVLKNIVSVNLDDGSITKLPDFTTADEVALEFWRSVEFMFPGHALTQTATPQQQSPPE